MAFRSKVKSYGKKHILVIGTHWPCAVHVLPACTYVRKHAWTDFVARDVTGLRDGMDMVQMNVMNNSTVQYTRSRVNLEKPRVGAARQYGIPYSCRVYKFLTLSIAHVQLGE